ncbi:DUF5977 domain-containing protein, partial [Arsenicibacter rosenii]|uniref:DUF5977 domain-containing protein n=1 Tax=Arsenicibacter rosenii TaxID=1750698 RepID=UPI001E4767A9
CAQNQAGAAATISIPANRYGSEISQADADAKAENEYNALNTQLYADTYGSCVVAPFLNTAFSRLGSFIRNNCPTDKVGSYATITIAAGTWGSVLSQADADAKAVAEANALDTQAFANANGSCIIPRQTLHTGFGVTVYVDRLVDNTYKLVVTGNVIAIQNQTGWGITGQSVSGGTFEKTYPASRFGTTVSPATITVVQSGGGTLGMGITSFTFF